MDYALIPQTNTTEPYTIVSKKCVYYVVSNKTKIQAVNFHKHTYKYNIKAQNL